MFETERSEHLESVSQFLSPHISVDPEYGHPTQTERFGYLFDFDAALIERRMTLSGIAINGWKTKSRQHRRNCI